MRGHGSWPKDLQQQEPPTPPLECLECHREGELMRVGKIVPYKPVDSMKSYSVHHKLPTELSIKLGVLFLNDLHADRLGVHIASCDELDIILATMSAAGNELPTLHWIGDSSWSGT